MADEFKGIEAAFTSPQDLSNDALQSELFKTYREVNRAGITAEEKEKLQAREKALEAEMGTRQKRHGNRGKRGSGSVGGSSARGRKPGSPSSQATLPSLLPKRRLSPVSSASSVPPARKAFQPVSRPSTTAELEQLEVETAKEVDRLTARLKDFKEEIAKQEADIERVGNGQEAVEDPEKPLSERKSKLSYLRSRVSSNYEQPLIQAKTELRGIREELNRRRQGNTVLM